MRPLAFACFLLSLFTPALIPRAGADTLLHFLTEPYRYLPQGEEATITPADGYTFSVKNNGRNEVNVSVLTAYPGTSYTLIMAAPTGSPLVPGDYPLTTAQGGPTTPQLTFGFGGGLDTGEFQILEISYDANGEVLSLAANFTNHSDYTETSTGQIRFNSGVPYLTPAGVAQTGSNFYRVHETADSLAIPVTRRGGTTGPLSVDYTTVDGTCLAGQDYTAASGTLTWADGDTADKTITVPILNTGDPYRRDGTFGVRLSGAGAGPQALATVTVVKDSSPVTFIHIDAYTDSAGQAFPEQTYSTATQNVIASRYETNGGTFFFGVLGDFDASFPGGAVTPNQSLFLASSWDQAALPVGDYQAAYSEESETNPCLTVAGFGPTLYYGALGSFQVLEAATDGDGNVLRFAANFTRPLEGRTGTLRGQIRYRSSVPLPTASFPQVTVAATTAAVSASGGVPGVFTLTRGGDLAAPLTVSYAVRGSAVGGRDYRILPGTMTIKAGKSSAQIKVKPIAAAVNTGLGKTVVKLTLQGGPVYDVGAGGSMAKVKILSNH